LLKRLGHTAVICQALPVAAKRDLLRRMVKFSRSLPRRFDQPLLAMLAQLSPAEAGLLNPPPYLPGDEVRRLADAVAAWHLRSPLGICLRRSLLRYHFLRQAGLPVQIVFGARLTGDRAGRGLGGHAWLLLNGAPYYEQPEDYEGFVEMVRYPERETRSVL
jgi:hypothetical protein